MFAALRACLDALRVIEAVANVRPALNRVKTASFLNIHKDALPSINVGVSLAYIQVSKGVSIHGVQFARYRGGVMPQVVSFGRPPNVWNLTRRKLVAEIKHFGGSSYSDKFLVGHSVVIVAVGKHGAVYEHKVLCGLGVAKLFHRYCFSWFKLRRPKERVVGLPFAAL